MNFYLGCAVWAYKGWVGDLFPLGSPTKDLLRLYSQRFTTVEGNTTFYAIPSQDTISRWVAETNPSFKFCLKLPRHLTHKGLLKPSIPGTLSFIELMQGLKERLGVIFVQLPPSYTPASLEDLVEFLTALPRQSVQIALEVRHRDWFQEPYQSQLTQQLEALGVGRVLLDSRPIYTGERDFERRKPQLPLQPSVTAPFSLIRFISDPEQGINRPFLEEWALRVSQWLSQGTTVYFFVHCPVEERSPHNARYFQHLLEQHASIPTLPWNTLNPPTQLKLF